eukprot:scaffold117722_cov31-Tisochrysis_lutea.AAC.3
MTQPRTLSAYTRHALRGETDSKTRPFLSREDKRNHSRCHCNIVPRLSDDFEVSLVDQHRGWSDGLDALVTASATRWPYTLQEAGVRRIRTHNDMIRLGDEDILLLDCLILGSSEKVDNRAGAVYDSVAVEPIEIAAIVLGREDGGNLSFEPIGLPAGRRDEAREARHLCARARWISIADLLPMVVHDTALPLLVNLGGRGEDDVIRLTR